MQLKTGAGAHVAHHERELPRKCSSRKLTALTVIASIVVACLGTTLRAQEVHPHPPKAVPAENEAAGQANANTMLRAQALVFFAPPRSAVAPVRGGVIVNLPHGILVSVVAVSARNPDNLGQGAGGGGLSVPPRIITAGSDSSSSAILVMRRTSTAGRHARDAFEPVLAVIRDRQGKTLFAAELAAGSSITAFGLEATL